MDNAVCFAVDRTYLPIALASAGVFAEEEPRNFDVVILLKGDTDPRLRIPAGVRIVPNNLEQLVPSEMRARRAWGPISYTRIFAPLALAGQYRRILYADADIGVFGAVSPLFRLDMKGRPLAAVESMMDEGAGLTVKLDLAQYKAALKIRDGRMFNSGVLLIDIGEWNRTDHQALLAEYSTNVQPRIPHRTGLAGDQEYLNFSLTGRWLGLSPKWNFQTFLERLGFEELIDPAIVHYVGPRRPWEPLLYPFGQRHTRYFKDRLSRIGINGAPIRRPYSHYGRFLANQLRQTLHNGLNTATKRKAFDRWQAARATIKQALERRWREGRYEDVEQGVSGLDLTRDPLSGIAIKDVVYYRREIRPKSSF